ncbi:MAG: 3-hydroxyacyl-CoA dehydrogenase family protein [Leifsonia sp.]
MTAPTAPGVVGVLGGGRMGAGIAHAFLCAGSEVRVVERDTETAATARDRVRAALEQSADRSPTPFDTDGRSRALTVSDSMAVFAGCDLVIEAVPEQLDLKIDALQHAETAAGPDAVLASNTSSLSIGRLGAELLRPAQFIGLHFFNPVPASALVEIVVGAETADSLTRDAEGWVAAIGKTAITVQDAPGFASSRLGVALGLEAIRMLEDGVASAEDIDTAMVLGYRHPVGPLRLTDLVGLDVRLGIAEYLHDRLGDRFEPPALLRRMVADGRLGRKTGEGFYVWDETTGTNA